MKCTNRVPDGEPEPEEFGPKMAVDDDNNDKLER